MRSRIQKNDKIFLDVIELKKRIQQIRNFTQKNQSNLVQNNVQNMLDTLRNINDLLIEFKMIQPELLNNYDIFPNLTDSDKDILQKCNLISTEKLYDTKVLDKIIDDQIPAEYQDVNHSLKFYQNQKEDINSLIDEMILQSN